MLDIPITNMWIIQGDDARQHGEEPIEHLNLLLAAFAQFNLDLDATTQYLSNHGAKLIEVG